MPRNRLLAQIDEELVQARKSLKFWRDQILFLADSQFQTVANSQVVRCEADIRRLLEAQEQLHDIGAA